MAEEKDKVLTAIVFDFETGGLNAQTCAATQISLHAVRLDTFEMVGKLNLYIAPYKYQGLEKPKRKVVRTKYEIQDEKDSDGQYMEYQKAAMDISGITMDVLKTHGVELQEVCERIIDFIESNTPKVTIGNKPFLIGQNPLFDVAFMQQIMTYTGLYNKFCKVVRCKPDYWGNQQPYYLDTLILGQLIFGNDKRVVNYKLGTLSEALNIDLSDAHDADADVTATEEIVRISTIRMRNADSGSTGNDIISQSRTKTREHFKI